MKDAFDFGASAQPARKGQRRIFDGFESHGQCFQTTQSQTAIIGRSSAADELLGSAELLPRSLFAGSDRAQE